MVKRRFIPPPTQAKGDAAVRRTVPRPNIQVPTLPRQSQTPLQAEVSAAQGRTVKGVENVPVNPPPTPHYPTNTALQAQINAYQPTGREPLQNVNAPTQRPAAQVQPDTGLQDRVASYQPTGREPLQNAAQPTRSDAPPPPQQNAAAGQARGMALSKNPQRPPPPPAATPARNAAIGAAAQQQSITAEKVASDRSPQNGQNQAKEKEKTPDKNRDKDHER